MILLSAESSPTARLHGYEAGADDFVLKPFVPEELLRKISLQFRVADTLNKLTQATLRLEELNERLAPTAGSRKSRARFARAIRPCSRWPNWPNPAI